MDFIPYERLLDALIKYILAPYSFCFFNDYFAFFMYCWLYFYDFFEALYTCLA